MPLGPFFHFPIPPFPIQLQATTSSLHSQFFFLSRLPTSFPKLLSPHTPQRLQPGSPRPRSPPPQLPFWFHLPILFLPDPNPPYLLPVLRPLGPGSLLQSLPPGRRSPARGQGLGLGQFCRPLSPILSVGGRRRLRSVAAAAPLHVSGWARRASAPRPSRPRTAPGRSAAAATTARGHHGPAGSRSHRPRPAASPRFLEAQAPRSPRRSLRRRQHCHPLSSSTRHTLGRPPAAAAIATTATAAAAGSAASRPPASQPPAGPAPRARAREARPPPPNARGLPRTRQRTVAKDPPVVPQRAGKRKGAGLPACRGGCGLSLIVPFFHS